MAVVSALLQRGDQLWRAFRQNNVAIEDHGVAGKTSRFFLRHIDQIRHVVADGALSVFIKCIREPDRASIGQRTEAGI
jgi:hypothetical protein